ncbi:hypothetical protein HH310_29450 [Actinoplanes sp. TBRC 11911]|uniref:hypothetical protein n=1 Tax=Actinoplanes sp. TBRC 11911 TaxID=2729386 RepID=UPI00145C91F4|nr:hypothetical protein [Actinoplanes sp. TBRC 11911]NMO55297.1 hypothetical protein [Actinoplanes sp. TBRC 11911]
MTSADRTPSRGPAYLGTSHLSRHRARRAQPSGQPWLGLAGLAYVIPFGVLFAVVLGGPERTTLVLGPITTAATPAIATIVLWWEDWPGTSLRAGWSGLTDTLLIAAAAVVLTGFTQVVVNGWDLRGVFLATPGPGHAVTYPVTMALAGTALSAMLQLTFVTEGWPLRGRRRLSRVWAGLIAFGIAWVVALAAWALVVSPGPIGDVSLQTYGMWLIILGAWQVVLFAVLPGRPFTLIRNRAARLITANVAIVVLTEITYALMRGLGVENSVIGAIGGVVVGAGLVMAVLFDGWPGTRIGGVTGDIVMLAITAALAAALYGVLAAVGSGLHLGRVSMTGWITLASLNWVGMVVLLHAAVWSRWPVIAQPASSTPEPAALDPGRDDHLAAELSVPDHGTRS